jgi:hypothetical protein
VPRTRASRPTPPPQGMSSRKGFEQKTQMTWQEELPVLARRTVSGEDRAEGDLLAPANGMQVAWNTGPLAGRAK